MATTPLSPEQKAIQEAAQQWRATQGIVPGTGNVPGVTTPQTQMGAASAPQTAPSTTPAAPRPTATASAMTAPAPTTTQTAPRPTAATATSMTAPPPSGP